MSLLVQGLQPTRWAFRTAHFRFPRLHQNLSSVSISFFLFFSSNIDSHIRQAETEYQLEREETNLLNLQDEKRTLLLRFGGSIHQWGRNGVTGNVSNNLASSLFRSVARNAYLTPFHVLPKKNTRLIIRLIDCLVIKKSKSVKRINGWRLDNDKVRFEMCKWRHRRVAKVNKDF